MGRWDINRSRRLTRVTFTRAGSASQHHCGEFASWSAPTQMVVDWVACRAVPGDVIAVNGLLELAVLPEGRA